VFEEKSWVSPIIELKYKNYGVIKNIRTNLIWEQKE